MTRRMTRREANDKLVREGKVELSPSVSVVQLRDASGGKFPAYSVRAGYNQWDFRSKYRALAFGFSLAERERGVRRRRAHAGAPCERCKRWAKQVRTEARRAVVSLQENARHLGRQLSFGDLRRLMRASRLIHWRDVTCRSCVSMTADAVIDAYETWYSYHYKVWYD